MDDEKMIHKVNEIARFFGSYPHEEAVAGIADHVQKFWEPRFRRQLVDYAAAGGAGLNPLAIEALRRVIVPAETL
jgi:formate dehydrogenase subunit delta